MTDRRRETDPNDEIGHSARQRDGRITIAGARRMLGMIGRNYSDEEVQEVLDILYGMAEVAYDDFVSPDDIRE